MGCGADVAIMTLCCSRSTSSSTKATYARADRKHRLPKLLCKSNRVIRFNEHLGDDGGPSVPTMARRWGGRGSTRACLNRRTRGVRAVRRQREEDFG